MRESWRATNFPFPPSDLQFSDNYTRTARPSPRHRSDILSWLRWPAFGHASTRAGYGHKVGIERRKWRWRRRRIVSEV